MNANTNSVLGQIQQHIIEMEATTKPFIMPEYSPDVLSDLLRCIHPVDFQKIAGYNEEKGVSSRDQYVICIDELKNIAKHNKRPIKSNSKNIFLYNGRYWQKYERENFGLTRTFLGKVAEKMGFQPLDAQYCKTQSHLLEQLQSATFIKDESTPTTDTVLINLQNGTLEVSKTGAVLRKHRADDNFTYCFSFDYDANATAPKYEKFLNEILPDSTMQQILHEFIGYTLTKNLKLEKALFLYGTDCNGKSVIYDIVRGLLGENNVSSFSLSEITKNIDYCRIRIKDKLLNYCSDDSVKMDVDIFKQMVSGEPITARDIYGAPCEIKDYAKLMFNTNIMPEQKDLDLNEATDRRFIIIPFEKQVKKEDIDVHLAKKICDTELSGIFNLVVEGLIRILQQEAFSECPAIEEFMKDHWDSLSPVVQFINEKRLERSTEPGPLLMDMHKDFKTYCFANKLGCPRSIQAFAAQLRKNKIEICKVGSQSRRVCIKKIGT
jgi:putative DNA primase/helicase